MNYLAKNYSGSIIYNWRCLSYSVVDDKRSSKVKSNIPGLEKLIADNEQVSEANY